MNKRGEITSAGINFFTDSRSQYPDPSTIHCHWYSHGDDGGHAQLLPYSSGGPESGGYGGYVRYSARAGGYSVSKSHGTG